jgi:hypothetical protein
MPVTARATSGKSWASGASDRLWTTGLGTLHNQSLDTKGLRFPCFGNGPDLHPELHAASFQSGDLLSRGRSPEEDHERHLFFDEDIDMAVLKECADDVDTERPVSEATVTWIMERRPSGGVIPVPSMPRPPALATAAASSGPATKAIPALITGWSRPNASVIRVLSTMSSSKRVAPRRDAPVPARPGRFSQEAGEN